MTGCLTVFLVVAPLVLHAQELRNVPLRINMGGISTEDSYGRIWLGDGPGAGDPLGIRPNDAGGTNWIENWSTAILQGDSLDNLGFDSTHPGDVYIFNTIRWDTGGDGIDFRLAIPVPEGEYTVNLYFNEACCINRHFKIEIEGEIVDEDVSYLDYDPLSPALGRAGRLSFEDIAVGADRLLDIAFLPCPVAECPEGGDINAIIDAIEVISGPDCDHLGLDLNAVYQAGPDAVELTWNGIPGADGFRIRKNGAPLGAALPSTARTFTDSTPRSGGQMPAYVLEALDGVAVMSQCRANVNAFACPGDLACAVDNDAREVALSWSPIGGINVTGIEVRRNGALLQTLPATATSFEDTPDARTVTYTVTAVTAPPGQCSPLSCTVTVESAPFALPLRIAMGNVETIDSRGRVWLGDGTTAGDALGIRPDDLSGTNAIQNWCPVDAVSFRKYGLDASHAGDRSIF
ncbi:MAG TPA: hypothetical protein VMT52_03720, partial [Planctomycetota bacterium]|nr:hypothetical protein [Planctomycetota bacterium]